jgi:hypothetical protein
MCRLKIRTVMFKGGGRNRKRRILGPIAPVMRQAWPEANNAKFVERNPPAPTSYPESPRGDTAVPKQQWKPTVNQIESATRKRGLS